ncbi:MAG: hypothetical protein JXR91_16915 [Deltaproteobacteria bacterium]|nr:hypothetical protein [Deltaproteobacteria bacterium]
MLNERTGTRTTTRNTTRNNRRIHTCFFTKNREYHIRSGECIAVRDRLSQVWIAGHKAIGMRLRALPPNTPYVGRALEFYSIELEQIIRTSPVVDIIRPNRNDVQFYGFVHGFAPDNDLVG